MSPDEINKFNANRKAREEEHKNAVEKINNVINSPSQPIIVECPYCKSKSTKKISSIGKGISIITLGLLSSKIGKQWHCNNCNSDF